MMNFLKPVPPSFPQLVGLYLEPVAGDVPYGAAGPFDNSARREDDGGERSEGVSEN